uniref:Uncharacterized protein n=1 Tax=Lactuca sativa TaxID=4236 RepID=A0A9R1XJQ0_LACSA|nr:hypothetical protein LSAT_V11C300149320 [Lactuca sativa]
MIGMGVISQPQNHQLLMADNIPTPPLTFYHQTPMAQRQQGYHFNQQIPTQDFLSRSVTSPFVKELLEYEIPNTAKLPHLKTYNGTADPDSHIDTYERTITSLKLDERF